MVLEALAVMWLSTTGLAIVFATSAIAILVRVVV